MRAQTVIPRGWIYALVILECFLPALFPGDAPFIGDEPHLIHNALEANLRHRPASVGLMGTRGLPYGPLPTWFYQAMLGLTHDLKLIVAIRALLFVAAMALTLLWLARSTGWSPIFVPVILLSPYLWYSSRPLWDNSFCVPLSAIMVAAYAGFIARPSRWKLGLTIAAGLGMFLTHLMSLPLIAAVVLHALTLQRRTLRRFWKTVTAMCVVGLAISWTYLAAMIHMKSAPMIQESGLNGWWFPLLGARVLSGAHLSYLYGPGWRGGGWGEGIIILAQAVSWIAYPLLWVGIFIALRRAWSLRRELAHVPAAVVDLANSDHIALIALTALIFQMLLDGLQHAYAQPHYYNGTWIIFVVLCWIATDEALRRARGAAAIILPLAQWAALATISLFLLARMHQARGVRNLTYGVSLGNQIEVVRDLNRLGCNGPFVFVGSDGSYVTDPFITEGRVLAVGTNVAQYQIEPFGANEIQKLNLPPTAWPDQPLWKVSVVYVSQSEADSRVAVVKHY